MNAIQSALLTTSCIGFLTACAPATKSAETSSPAETETQAADDVTLLNTTLGPVQGAQDGDVVSFKGIPFAKPPVGELRWRAPQPVQAWNEPLDATTYGSDCMQIPFPSDAAPLGVPHAEDCLYLNVWKPARTEPDTKLPVMVWIYGGGLQNGGTSPDVYDGSEFARQNVILMSMNYRLGRFGFFAHPALSAEGAVPHMVNYG